MSHPENNKKKSFTIRFAKKEKSGLRQAAINLGDKNSKTLGHIVYQRWNDYFKNGNLILALDEAEGLAGFLAYTPVKKSCTITLSCLCIDEEYREYGLARKLNDFLVENFKQDYREIRLKCRVDYDLNNFWKSLGYYPIREQDGRATRKSSTLMNWKRDLGHVNLFNFRETSFIDVFIDYKTFSMACKSFLRGERSGLSLIFDGSSSSREGVNICICQEHLIEISQALPRSDKNLILSFSDREFRVVESSPSFNSDMLNHLSQNFKEQVQRLSLEKDISSCIVNGITFLIADIPQELAWQIEADLGLRILNPANLNSDISSSIQACQYSPSIASSFKLKELSVVEA